tara:strand:+ start:3803 stop:3958 length:156 start_codon:yes stop_codon:yes gene_type:complete
MSNDKPQTKRDKLGFIFYMLLLAGLMILLLLAACEPINVKTLIKLKVTNHA